MKAKPWLNSGIAAALIVTGTSALAQYQPPPASPGPSNENSEGARDFRAVCSQCHALPNPAMYSPGQWPYVVAQMEGIMRSMGREVPSESMTRAIDEYLQQQAGGAASHQQRATQGET